MITEDRADLREQLGCAFHASDLDVHGPYETPLFRVAALGAAAAAIQCGADRQNLPIAAMQPEAIKRGSDTSQVDMRRLMLHPPARRRGLDPRDVITSELAPLLWHIRYGVQHEQVPLAVDLLARWLAYTRMFAGWESLEQARLLQAFSARILHEWLSDRCRGCGGCGKLERTADGNMVRPRGSMQRNAVFRPCPACGGSGCARPRAAERTRQLGISMRLYDSHHWAERFTRATAWLTLILERRLTGPLTRELGRGRFRR